jgi:hypothetical protein
MNAKEHSEEENVEEQEINVVAEKFWDGNQNNVGGGVT